MKVIRASVLGFCMGVRRAVNKAFIEAKKANGSMVYSLGSLVHNPVVLEDLKNNGVEILAEIPSVLNGSAVIIRAHGISPEQKLSLREKGAKIIDATCPKVKKSQEKARELAGKGYGIFLAGEAHHAEIEGITGFAKDAPFCVVVENAKEAEDAACAFAANAAYKGVKTALLGQTTISEEEYLAIAETIKKYLPDITVCDTICSATTDRQQALRKLLGKTDAVIVAGGRESANTRRLFSIAQESGKPCALAESAADIPHDFFGYETIGISAGASTPDCVIYEIEDFLISS